MTTSNCSISALNPAPPPEPSVSQSRLEDDPLIARLNDIARTIARGRVFPDSTPLIRALRDGTLATYEDM